VDGERGTGNGEAGRARPRNTGLTMTREDGSRASVDAWLQAAVADAERRGLPGLKPLLEGLAQSTILLRAADWNEYVPAVEEGAEADGGTTGAGQ
jgi:hypothetical protein